MKRSIFLIILPLILSSFTHLWNPIGFPDFFSDEGVYLRRSLHTLGGLGPQEYDTYYDHPFFGQIFLACIFFLIGYPSFLSSSLDLHSIEMLFTIPRVLMGLLAVVDTFLIFKITDKQYNYKVAIIASVLFAVMPMSWFTRRILLENIQLPFLLSSILFALYSRYPIVTMNKNNKINRKLIFVLLSGIFLGVSIFTKIPVFVMIPLIAFLILKNTKNGKNLSLWFIPVIIIPLIWPAYSLTAGQFSYWLDVFKIQIGREGAPLSNSLLVLFQTDPVLLILAASGLMIVILKRDVFALLWAMPNFIFLLLIAWGWAPYHLFIPLIPLFCILGGVLIFDIIKRIARRNIRKIAFGSITAALAIFGLISTTLLITNTVTTGQIQIIKFVSSYLENQTNGNESIMVVSNPIYSWIFKYVYDKDNVLNEVNDFDYETVKTNKILFISDVESESISSYSERLRALYNTTNQIFKINGLADKFDTSQYPFASMEENYESMDETEVRFCSNNCVRYD